MARDADDPSGINGHETRNVVAEKVGFVSGKNYERTKSVVEHGSPELVGAMDSGAASIYAANDIATLPESEQQEIVAKGEKEILEAAHSVDEVKDIRDKALAMEAYARQVQDNEMQIWAGEIKMRAERRAGQMLKDMDKATGGRPEKTGYKVLPVNSAPTLSEVGITPKQSSLRLDLRLNRHSLVKVVCRGGDFYGKGPCYVLKPLYGSSEVKEKKVVYALRALGPVEILLLCSLH